MQPLSFFDLASQDLVMVIEYVNRRYIKTNCAPDPTSDGAFPNGWRNDFEIAPLDNAWTLIMEGKYVKTNCAPYPTGDY